MNEEELATRIMDLLIMLLDDQTGVKHEYRLLRIEDDKTA